MPAHALKLVQNPSAPSDNARAADDSGLAAASEARFLTRHPILDTRQNIVGYELKLRSNVPVAVLPGATSLQQMQDEALLVSVIDLDYQRALGSHITFLPLAGETLASELVDQLPAGKVVLCLAAQALAENPALVERCRQLASAGIELALDHPERLGEAARADLQAHALPWAYTRLAITGLDGLQMAEHMDALLTRRPGAGVPSIIAIGVDTEELFEAACRLPFTLFQGDYLTQVRPASGHRIGASRVHVMELLNLVMSEAELPVLEEKFKRDAALAYKLMRYLNSAALGLRQPVKSIGHALYMLGHDQLYRWLTLLLFAGDQGDPRSQTLLRNALVRARLTENLGLERVSREERGGLFIVGILSLLDALLNLPMQQALANLNLPPAVVDALVRREGPFSTYLKLAIACENHDQDSLARLADEAGIDAQAVNLAHISALIWSESLEI